MVPTPCLLKFLAFSALLASTSTGFAQNTTYRWVGTTSDWTSAGNWAVVSGTGGTPPTTGGTIAARINVGTASALTPPSALVYSSAQGTTIFNPSDRALVIANNAASATTATVTITGGTFDSRGTGDIICNANGSNSGTLNISGGHYTNVNGGTSDLTVGFNGGTANLNISSGSATTGRIVFLTSTAGINTTANVALSDSGILETGGFARGSASNILTSNISFNGGTLRARGADNADFMTSTVMTGNALVRVGGAAIDTNGFNIGISKALTQDGSSPGGGLTKSGTGTLTLSGANTYTGATTISQGTLGANNIVVSGGNSNLGNATSAVTLGSAGAQGILSYTGNTATYTRGFTIGGAGGGRLDVTTSGQTLTVGTGAVTGSGLFTVGGAGNTSISSNVTHTGGLTKTGSGTLTISGSGNTYTGATTISGGSMALSGAGSIANSSSITINSSTSLNVTGLTGNFTVGASQSLGGSGTLTATGKTVIASGTLTPGNSPGTLTQDGGTLQLAVGGDYNWQVYDANGVAGTGYDTVSLINGAVLDLSALSAGNTYNINLWSLSAIGPDVNGNAINFNNALSYAWTLFSTGSVISGFDTNLFTINTGAFNGTNGFTNTLNGNFSLGLADGGTDIVLTYTPIPEPTTALLGSFGLLLLLRRRR